MTTYISDKCNEIRGWFAIGSDVYPNSVVTGWIRMAEEFLSSALRVKHMVQIDTALVTQGRVALPLDWQEIRYVRTVPDGTLLRYNTIDDFQNPEWPDAPSTDYPGRSNRYTIIGNYLLISPPPVAGTQVSLAYYQNIPPLTEDANNWVNIYSPTLYTLKILHIASLYAIDDERNAVWDTEVMKIVGVMNARHQVDKASGSALQIVRRKTFG